MFGIHKKYREKDEALEKALKGLAKPKLSAARKKEVRDQLLMSIAKGNTAEHLPLSLRHLAKAVRRKGNEVSIPSWAAVMLKERLLDYIEMSDRWRNQQFFDRGAGMLRTVVASVLLVVFAFSAVVFVPFKAPRVQAKTTYLDSVSGEVLVVRKTALLEAKPMMSLEEGDKILTRDGGVATIRYFDDSISRLAEKTSIQMKRLYAEPLNPVITRVEIDLEEGRMWTRVVNLADESNFMVHTPDMRADVQKKAAFDIHTDGEKTEVAVYDNVVEITSREENTTKPSKLVIAGYKAEVARSQLDGARIEKIDERETNEWVAVNLSDDEAYETKLVEDQEETVEQGGEEYRLASSFSTDGDPEVEATKQKINDAYATLMNAEVQFVRGAQKEGEKGLKQYKEQLGIILNSIVAIEKRDPLYAQMLREMLQEKVDMQLKDFGSLQPGDNLYRAKEALQQTELALAPGDVEQVKIQLAQAEDALLEMQELLKDNKSNLAETLLRRYQNRANNFSVGLSEKNARDLDEQFVSLIEQQANHIKLLTALEHSIQYRDQFEFRDEIRRVRDDTLRKFLIALDQNPNRVPENILLEVKDLYDLYGGDESAVKDMIDPAVERLLAKEFQVTFLNPGEGGAAEPGVIVLTSGATEEVAEADWLLESHSGGGEESED